MKRQSRNYAIEVFRCLMMFLIVITHCHCHGIWANDRSRWTLLFLLLTWHVDGFLAISGWFGLKFSWKKVLRLWGMMAFYSLLSIAYGLFFHPEGYGVKDIRIEGGWFGNTYLFLLFLSPFLNGGVEMLARQGRRALLLSWLGLALVFMLQWTPLGVKIGVCYSGASVYSLMTFVFVYLTARVMREIDINLSAGKLIGTAFAVYGIGLAIPVFGYYSGWKLISRMHNYQAPYVWLVACLFLLLFARHVRVPSSLGRFCALISPSMFCVYLIHDVTSFGRKLYVIPESYLAGLGCHPVVAIICSAGVCFIACLVIDMIRRGALHVVGRAVRFCGSI